MTFCRVNVFATTWLLTAIVAIAQGPSVERFGEGWKRVVPVPMPELGDGDRYVVWVEDGWLQTRRETAEGVTDWHIVLARANHLEAPEILAQEGTVRFEVSYAGKYFVREDANVLRSLRQRKSSDHGTWPKVKFSLSDHKNAGSTGSPEQQPMLLGWIGEAGFIATSQVGPADDSVDCLIRLSPLVKEAGYGYENLHGSPLKRVFYGENCWVLDDGELLVAQRTLAAGVMANLEVGDTAPALAAKGFDGTSIKLENYRGKYVLLDFWATWCKPCVAEIPDLKIVHDEFGKDGRLVIISVSLDEDIDAPKKFVAEQSINWLQASLGSDPETTIAKDYGVLAIPATFLIGPDGKIIAKGMRAAKIAEVVSNALGDAASR